MTRLLFVALAGAVLAGCESPILAGRPSTDVYTFTLPSSPPAILRWHAGATIRVHVAPHGDAQRDARLAGAFQAGAALWNALALFGEFRLVPAAGVTDADVVLAWADAPLPVDTRDCLPTLQRAVTTFCIAGFGTDSARLIPFPLRPPANAADSRVVMLVTLLGTEALVPGAVPRLVAHELGHVLGIGRHSADPGDLMFTTDPVVSAPSRRDAATVQVLYHTQPDIVAGR